MKNSPLIIVLLCMLAGSALFSLVFCGWYISNARELRTLQITQNQINYMRQVAQGIAKDALEYSHTHPDINPILEASAIKPPPATSTNKPATK